MTKHAARMTFPSAKPNASLSASTPMRFEKFFGTAADSRQLVLRVGSFKTQVVDSTSLYSLALSLFPFPSLSSSPHNSIFPSSNAGCSIVPPRDETILETVGSPRVPCAPLGSSPSPRCRSLASSRTLLIRENTTVRNWGPVSEAPSHALSCRGPQKSDRELALCNENDKGFRDVL